MSKSIAGIARLGFIGKWTKAIEDFGVKGTVLKLYQMGDIKWGNPQGADQFGNKYFENLEYPFGQTRWVEYKDLTNFDSSEVPAGWHSWLHGLTDDVPEHQLKNIPIQETVAGSHNPFSDHVGYVNQKEHQENLTGFRERGYQVGSVKLSPTEEPKFERQPAHPLNFSKERYHNGGHSWDPSNPDVTPTSSTKPARDINDF